MHLTKGNGGRDQGKENIIEVNPVNCVNVNPATSVNGEKSGYETLEEQQMNT